MLTEQESKIWRDLVFSISRERYISWIEEIHGKIESVRWVQDDAEPEEADYEFAIGFLSGETHCCFIDILEECPDWLFIKMFAFDKFRTDNKMFELQRRLEILIQNR